MHFIVDKNIPYVYLNADTFFLPVKIKNDFAFVESGLRVFGGLYINPYSLIVTFLNTIFAIFYRFSTGYDPSGMAV